MKLATVETGRLHEGKTETGEAEPISLCALRAGEGIFGIDTRTIREVLGKRVVRRVPLAPAFIAGIVSYRGQVLTTVSLRALLGLSAMPGDGCVMVLEDEKSADRFGLLVDGVGGVMLTDRRSHTANPSTLDRRSDALYEGLFRLAQGVVIQLTPRRLRPVVLAQNDLFQAVPSVSSQEPRFIDRAAKPVTEGAQ